MLDAIIAIICYSIFLFTWIAASNVFVIMLICILVGIYRVEFLTILIIYYTFRKFFPAKQIISIN